VPGDFCPLFAEGNPPGHDLGEALGVARLPFGLGVAIGEDRLVAAQVVLVAGAQGVEQFVGDDHQVALVLVAVCKTLITPIMPLRRPGMIQVGAEGRVVIEHEQTDLGPWPGARHDARPTSANAGSTSRSTGHSPGRKGRRQRIEGRSQIEGQWSLQGAAMALDCSSNHSPMGAKSAGRCDGPPGDRRAVGGNGVQGDVEGVLPVGGPGVAAPRADRYRGEDEQQDRDAQFAKHGGGGRRR
jgi:hypothetical protein